MKAKGKHQSNRLTNRTINKLTEPKRYADGKGLYLLVDKAGNKRWMMRISIDGKRRDIGLGSWPLVSVSKVRIKASRIRLQVSEGIDPLAERRSARKEILTFQQAAVAVYESHRRSWKNAKHAAQWISTLERYAFPVCGVLPVDQIGTNHIMAVLNPIWLEKPETARRVRQRLSAVMDWAKAQGHRSDENPVTGITRALPKQSNTKTHHKALPYQELPTLISDIRQSGSSMTVRLALEFLILTATRTSEVLLAMWSEIDWSNKCWNIPGERMKSGRPHSVPLAPTALSLLKQAKIGKQDDGFIFPGRQHSKPLSQDALRMALRHMGRAETPHGFRSTFRDWSAERTNMPREVCEAALAHVNPNKTEAAYLRTTVFDKRKRLMEDWASFVESTPADVIKLTASN